MSEGRDSTYPSHPPGATTAEGAGIRGRVCVITGANRGIGRATALGLARMGATVAILGRDAERCIRARDEIRHSTGNASVSYLAVDLGSLASVRQGAAELGRRFPAIHVLVNNAGVNLARRTASPDGLEMTFAVNHLGPFLLTNLLRPLLRAGAPSRIITVTSWFERFGRMAFDDLQGSRRYGPLRAYYQSKLANVLFTYALARRLAGSGVTANCVDPGLVATDLLRDRRWWRPRWLRAIWGKVLLSPDSAARLLIDVATSPALSGTSGVCFARGAWPARTSLRSYDNAVAEELWRVSAGLTGLEAHQRDHPRR
jgi:NAD(P)-dependent dehydrogenase (short-subunit alcohol dehydrogenase family)